MNDERNREQPRTRPDQDRPPQEKTPQEKTPEEKTPPSRRDEAAPGTPGTGENIDPKTGERFIEGIGGA